MYAAYLNLQGIPEGDRQMGARRLVGEFGAEVLALCWRSRNFVEEEMRKLLAGLADPERIDSLMAQFEAEISGPEPQPAESKPKSKRKSK